MLSRNTPQALSSQAPPILFELRKAFDERWTDLAREATGRLPSEPPEGHDSTTHVYFEHGGLLVTAVYNRVSEEFTQLIARAIEEEGADRPSFTISLFL
ncbi:MAG TPA: hypothetical protein VGE21_00965 [Flavobacteriales bacterium]